GVRRITVDGRDKPMASRENYAIVNQPVPEEHRRRFVQVRGVVDPKLSAEVHGLPLVAGRWFSQAGVLTPEGEKPGEHDQIEAVLGTGVAREFGKTRHKESLEVGDTFELGDRIWVVVGLLQGEGTAFGSETWAKQDIVAKLFNKGGYSSIVLRVAD